MTVVALGLSAPAATTPSPWQAAAPAAYVDRAGDTRFAPDVVGITIEPSHGALAVAIDLAEPTELGPYGWIILALDTDRSRATGGMHGSEVFVLANGERVVLVRRIFGRFVARPLVARLTTTRLEFALSQDDVRRTSFDFAVATLRQDADVAPDAGVFRYPARLSAG